MLSDTALVAGIGLILNCLVWVITGTWQLGKQRTFRSEFEISERAKTNEKLLEFRREIDQVLIQLKKDSDQEFNVVRRETGEMGQAIRNKIGEVELWSRDNYVRRDSFYKIVDQIQENFRLFYDKIDDKMDKINDKIDSLITTTHKPRP